MGLTTFCTSRNRVRLGGSAVRPGPARFSPFEIPTPSTPYTEMFASHLCGSANGPSAPIAPLAVGVEGAGFG
jgi:hypothetical protein